MGDNVRPMDPLSAILEALRIRGSLYFWTELTPPWGIQVPAFGHVVRYHLVLRGHCWVRVNDRTEPQRLEAGDLVAIPHGRAHVLSDSPKTPAITLEHALEQAGFTGEGALVVGRGDTGRQTRLVCGHFTHEADAEHPLFRTLPDCIILRGVARPDSLGLDQLLDYIAREVATNGPGTTAIVTRLAEILFVQTLRSYIKENPARSGGLAGFLDPHVGPVLAQIEQAPGESWTVAGLARIAGLSRTRFAVRFRALMGTTPLAYLTRWRMTAAKKRLCEPRLSVAQVAEGLGYRSEAAFNRAFTRAFKTGPGAYRRKLARRGAEGEGRTVLALKRVHDVASPDDGVRVLIDRLWPRGVSRKAARIDLWAKDVAPSAPLRTWFAHAPKRWSQFKRRYEAELKARPDVVNDLLQRIKGRKATLLFAAADRRFNNGVVLLNYLRRFDHRR